MKLFSHFLFITAFSISVFASETKYLKSTQTCQHFTQEFYSWYLPFLVKNGYSVTLKTVFNKKKSLFSGPLLQMLKEDSDAQDKHPGEIVGIDWDPFLNTQDPAQKYTVQNCVVSHDSCSAETWSGRTISTKTPKPDVIANLKWVNGGWKFVNFEDPSLKPPNDLMSALARAKRNREKKKFRR